MPLHLTYTGQTNVPVEVEGIVPEKVGLLSLGEIANLKVFHGNESAPLSAFFEIEGEPSDQEIDWHGDLTGVHWIGAKMTAGEMRLHGNSGRHIGSEMKGGSIHVMGDAGDWVGGEMKGGLIRVDGSAGHLVGAAYRGSRRGMTGGTILIKGRVGNELGHTMRRGLVVVGGDAGDLIGFNMLAGTILVFGSVGIRHGAGMRRGTIGLLGERCDLLPSFRFGCRVVQPAFMNLIYRNLQSLDYDVSTNDQSSGARTVPWRHDRRRQGGGFIAGFGALIET